MSRGIALILFIFSIVATTNAQEPPTILSRFELLAGPSISNNTGYLNSYDSKTGYAFGIGYYQKVTKSISLNIRSLYEAKGSAATYSYSFGDINGNFDINDKYTTDFKYITFYALPTFQFGRNKNIHISAGGYYSSLQKLSVNSYRTRMDNGGFISENTNTNKNYFSHKYDAGVSFQIGYSFKLSNRGQLMLQAFTNRGLVDLGNGFIGSQRNNTSGLLLSLKIR